MSHQDAKTTVKEILSLAGIAINGQRPWDIRVLNDELYPRLLSEGSLGAGDSYVDGWWEVDKLDEFFYRIFMSDLDRKLSDNWQVKAANFYARLFNRQTKTLSKKVAEVHYNLGNDVFEIMLDKRMLYTCAYWEDGADLHHAQEAKLDLVCRKLELAPGMRVLDLGCGWGGFAKYAAEHFGVRVLGVNIAEEQVKLGRKLCDGLPVEFRVQDYRDVKEKFDRVLSLGMIEHIGPKNYRTYMENAARLLKSDGIAFIHTIGQNSAAYRCEPWFDKHIFPNSVTPALGSLAAAMEGLFVVEDCHNIGPHYDPTLMAWHENLSRGWHLLEEKYGKRFYRKMKYYLLSSAGSFRARRSQVFQIVMTKPGRLQPQCRAAA